MRRRMRSCSSGCARRGPPVPPPMRTRSLLAIVGSPTRAIGAYAAAGALLWLFFRDTETHALLDGLRSAGWRLLALAVAVRLASLLLSSLRWQLLLSPIQAVPFEDVVSTLMMGMAVAAVAPMQAAEVVRPYLLA